MRMYLEQIVINFFACKSIKKKRYISKLEIQIQKQALKCE
jgi:hypothetical protein